MSKEEAVYSYWKENDIFNKTIEENEHKPEYVFYDGPPFMTGLPHYGHILAGLIKDSVLRYNHNKGMNVPRFAGHDDHGLPIEYEIEKELGIKTTQEVEEYGIGKYNEACRSIVLRYSKEWEEQMGRLGRWIDFKNQYATMDKTFMNSVWWIFSELYKKGRVYEGVKIMGYSTTCATPLSNFEIQQNYQEVQDDSLFIKLQVREDFKGYDNLNIMVWTTTPWTLPSNYCLCVGENIDYVIAEWENQKYILAEKLVINVFQKKVPTILEKFKGIELVNLTYNPPFTFNPLHNDYKIISGDFVTDSDGTGIVHLAPMYGEDDYNICIQKGIITKETRLLMILDANGYVNDLIPDLKGMFYKNFKNKDNQDLNTWVIISLKKQGLYWDKRQYAHNYPFCWRSDTPLIYRAVNSWFVKVEDMRERLCELNSEINWVPKPVGNARFHNWLSNAKDWGISRNRYWGTPIPIWKSEEGDIICVSSSYELEELANLPRDSITDLHRHHIDDIEIVKDGKVYKRISAVYDCWFESGSMPYATVNRVGILELLQNIRNVENKDDYGIKRNGDGEPCIIVPTENGPKSYKILPADFIAEGLDQTRGWFYTLLVLSASLFDTIPFKNVIVNGLVLAEDGKKMSKRLKNYPDPMEIVNEYGSDALRLYLLGSQATRAEPLKFSKLGVFDVVKEIIIPLTNSINFWKEYATLYVSQKEENPIYDIEFEFKYGIKININPLNLWIIKKYSDLRNEYKMYMDSYDLKSAVNVLYKLVQVLNNGYIKMGRFILKGKETQEEWQESLSTLFYILRYILYDFRAVMPFFCEYSYILINEFICKLKEVESNYESVHLNYIKDYITLSDEQQSKSNDFDIIYNIIINIYALRGQNDISMKKPIKNIKIIAQNRLLDIYSSRYQNYLNIVSEECNILGIEVETEDKVKINKQITPLQSQIFKKYGKEVKSTFDKIKILDQENLQIVLDNGDYDGYAFDSTMFNIKNEIILQNEEDNKDNSNYVYRDFQYGINKDKIMILLNKSYDEMTDKLYYYRLVATSIQRSRKLAGLHPWDNISAEYSGEPKYNLEEKEAQDYIKNITRINLNRQYNKEQSYIYSQEWENINLTLSLKQE
jgi:isoleucyl-tRNA synthetase